MAPPISAVLRDVGYATLGAGDVAAETARTLTRGPLDAADQLRDLRTRAPELVRQRYEELTDRGRRVADRFAGAPMVERVAGRANQVAEKAKVRTPAFSSDRSGTRYENRTLDELQSLAAERAIEGRTGMKKAELIAALRAGE